MTFRPDRITLTIISVFILIGLLFFIIVPSTRERLEDETWVVQFISFKGQKFLAQSLDVSNTYEGKEAITFNSIGTCSLPGYYSYKVNAKWKVRDDSLYIKGDSIPIMYQGPFHVSFPRSNSLLLKSTFTKIYCVQWKQFK